MRRTTGYDVAAGLGRAEKALRVALARAARDRSATADATTPPLQDLDLARAHLRSARRSLTALAGRIGLEPLAVGPLDKPEDSPPIGGGPGRLRRD